MTRVIAVLLAVIAVLCLSSGVTPAGDDKGTVLDLGGLKAKLPADWEMQKPASRLRLYQVRIPKAKDDPKDAEMVVFFFGVGSGGSVKQNLERWKGQFQAPKGKDIDDVAKVTKFKVGDAKVIKLDIEGTYLEKFPPFAPNAKVFRRENYRRFGVIVESEKGPHFITVTGPARTMGQNAEKFDKWLKSLK